MTNGTATPVLDANKGVRRELDHLAPRLAATGLVTVDVLTELTDSLPERLRKPLLAAYTAAKFDGLVEGCRLEAKAEGVEQSAYLTRQLALTG